MIIQSVSNTNDNLKSLSTVTLELQSKRQQPVLFVLYYQHIHFHNVIVIVQLVKTLIYGLIIK